ncbi:MAG: HAMP domain-containing histidine kinase [Xanthomonadales bacterium]|nr:HAMP domain-containing histidine kinase [Xanthomonadales bacterium]
MARIRSGLRQRMLAGLLGYAVLLTMAVYVHGSIINEHAENLVWQSLLDNELDHFLERHRIDPDFHWVDTDSMVLYDSRESGAVPSELLNLSAGVHDGIRIRGSERVVMVRKENGHSLILALDITDLEAREEDMTLTVVGSALALILLLALAIAWGVSKLLRPLSLMAKDIGDLRPDQPGQRVRIHDSASSELVVIAEALNDYLQRNDRFVERERVFIDSASHELRTPIALIGGASSIALEDLELSTKARHQLQRIHRTVKAVEQLIALLLVLAKDPQRLARASDRIALDQLLPEIVDDHRHLTSGKDLLLTIDPLPACEITAPLPIVQTTIGNLLRNAIENSDRGEIFVRLGEDALVTIDDPGHGMSPEEISVIYAQIARGGGERRGGGIGIDLISRICEHLGWHLEFFSRPSTGTRTTLRFRK